MQKEVLSINGMSCGHCVNSIENALKDIGVTGKVDLLNKKLDVQYDEAELSLQTIKSTIEELGYEVK